MMTCEIFWEADERDEVDATDDEEEEDETEAVEEEPLVAAFVVDAWVEVEALFVSVVVTTFEGDVRRYEAPKMTMATTTTVAAT